MFPARLGREDLSHREDRDALGSLSCLQTTVRRSVILCRGDKPYLHLSLRRDKQHRAGKGSVLAPDFTLVSKPRQSRVDVARKWPDAEQG